MALLLFLTDSWSSSDFLTCVHLCANVTVMKQKTVHAMMRNRSMKPVITLIILHVADEQFTDSFILLVIVTVWRNELVNLLFLQIPFFTPYFHFEDNSSTSALLSLPITLWSVKVKGKSTWCNVTPNLKPSVSPSTHLYWQISGTLSLRLASQMGLIVFHTHTHSGALINGNLICILLFYYV